jgi:uncharacterized protein Veg
MPSDLKTIERELHAVVESHLGEQVSLRTMVGHKTRETERTTMRGVLSEACAHGFLVTTPAFRTFVTYVDLYCRHASFTSGYAASDVAGALLRLRGPQELFLGPRELTAAG